MRKHRLFLTILGVLVLVCLPFLLGAKAEATGGQRLAAPGLKSESDSEARDKQHHDDAVRLLADIGVEDWKAPADVATGRFLNEIETKLQVVKSLDTEKLHVVAQGPGWARLTGPCRPQKHWSEPEEDEKVVVLDVVVEEGRWKLENLRVTPRRDP